MEQRRSCAGLLDGVAVWPWAADGRYNVTEYDRTKCQRSTGLHMHQLVFLNRHDKYKVRRQSVAGLGSIPGRSKWQWDRILYESCSFPLLVPFHQCSIVIH